MARVSDIERHLAALADAGRWDKRGRYSLRHSGLVAGLREFQLDNPGYCVLKLIQAAVGAGSNAVEMRVGRFSCELGFDACLSGSTLVELYSYLVRQDSALTPLAEGLGSALHFFNRVTLETGGPEAGRLQATGTSLNWEPGESETTRSHLVLDCNPWLAWKLKRWSAENLEHRCRFCPIPVHFDGAIYGQGQGLEYLSNAQASAPEYHVIHRRLAGGALWMPVPRDEQVVVQVADADGGRVRRCFCPSPRTGGVLALTNHLGRPTLQVVDRGVELDPVSLALDAPGFLAVLPGHKARCEPGSFQPGVPPALEQELQRHYQQMLDEVVRYRDYLGDRRSYWVQELLGGREPVGVRPAEVVEFAAIRFGEPEYLQQVLEQLELEAPDRLLTWEVEPESEILLVQAPVELEAHLKLALLGKQPRSELRGRVDGPCLPATTRLVEALQDQPWGTTTWFAC